jgi:hypothetical protein
VREPALVWVQRAGWLMVRRRPRSSASIRQRHRTRRSTCTFMVARGARAMPRTPRTSQRCSSIRARLYVSGHSSGGHLAAVVLTTDWQKDFGLPIDTVKGGLCASGMYDLYPVRPVLTDRYEIDINRRRRGHRGTSGCGVGGPDSRYGKPRESHPEGGSGRPEAAGAVAAEHPADVAAVWALTL